MSPQGRFFLLKKNTEIYVNHSIYNFLIIFLLQIPSSLQLQPTQSSLKSRSGKNLSEMSLHPGSTLKVEKTQEDDVTEPKRSELEVASTQRSRINKDDDFVVSFKNFLKFLGHFGENGTLWTF